MSTMKVVVWLTGCPSSGKTTLAQQLQEKFGAQSEFVDGDVVRNTISKDLQHGSGDRKTNLDRVLNLILTTLETKDWIFAAFVSPDAKLREYTRGVFEEKGYKFVEVYVHADGQTLEGRDVKGLYKRYREGDESILLPGLNDTYEAPTHPDYSVDTASEEPSESVNKLYTFLADIAHQT